MKLYELTYLISPELSTEEASSLSENISSLIQEKEGALEGVMPLLKKQLAYPIKKKTSAYLASLNFEIEPKKLTEIKKEIELKKKILRYLLLTVVKVSPKAKTRSIKEPLEAELAKGDSFSLSLKKAEEVAPKKKVEIKELEKKLDEVLK